MKDLLFFLVKHIPFWSVPFGLICGELVYIMWMREKKTVSVFFTFCAVVCLASTVYYYVYGGPVGSMKKTIEILNYLQF